MGNFKQLIKTTPEFHNFPLRKNESIHDGDFLAVEQVIRFVPRGGKILDIGCGSAKKSWLLHKLGYEVWGMDDFSDYFDDEDFREKVMQTLPSFGVQIIKHDVFKPFPLPNNSFDCITMFNILEHFHHSPKGVFQEVKRVLCMGGVVVIQVPNAVNFLKRIKVIFGKTNYPPLNDFLKHRVFRGHIREYTLSEVKDLLNYFEFSAIQCYGIPYYSHLIKPKFLRKIHKLLCHLKPSFAESLIGVGKKSR